MRYYMISDTHFNHTNIIKYCNRPFNTVEEMNSTIIKNWNSVVRNDDMVIHLGDVGLGNREKIGAIISSLNGRKMLIRGNHDNFTDSAYRDMGFEFVSKFPILWRNFFLLSHAPLQLTETTPYFNCYGHVHNDEKYHNTKNSKNFAVEVIDYTPVLVWDSNKDKFYI